MLIEERLRILELIEAGEIDVEEGARRLEALVESSGEARASSAPADPAARPAWVRGLWQAVFWTGVALMAGGGLLMQAVYTDGITAGWLAWGWVLLVFGMLGTMLGWWLQRARWLSLRVRPHEGRNISLALPLPLGPIAWVLHIARPFVPQLEEMKIEELILAMREEIRDGESPFLMVEVNGKEDREQVQVCFG
jgi:hypothetical protein